MSEPAALKSLLKAIVEDDRRAVQGQLKGWPELATAGVRAAKLYDDKIFHWLYVNDTPLHLAAAGHRAEIARQLLDFGADPNAANNMRCSTPLHYAADGAVTAPGWNSKQQVETIRCLLDRGAHLHAQDKNGATPLHRAVRTRCSAAVQCLLKAGANPMLTNKPGSTPFHLAVQNTGRGGSGATVAIEAQREIIQEFLSIGISPSIEALDGKTVLASARTGWIRDLLLSATSSQ